MKKKVFNSRIEFLNDTIAYYWGKPERKCLDEAVICCRYLPVNEHTEGCAIGRHLSPELSAKLDRYSESGVSNKTVFYQLPEWMQELGQDFLVEVQIMHDGNTFICKLEEKLISRMEGFVDVNEIIFPAPQEQVPQVPQVPVNVG